MAGTKAKRCLYCGGTMWQDGDVVKCFMCSRPAGSRPSAADRPSNLSNPKLPGSGRGNPLRIGKR